MDSSLLWPPSFPDAVAMANRFFACRWYLDASYAYLAAAKVAPTATCEDWMLKQAWVASERHDGRRSELEA